MKTRSKRGPKCRCRDCKKLDYESGDWEASIPGAWYCEDESERSWAWRHSGHMDGFMHDHELKQVHRCPLFEQRKCSKCGRKTTRFSIFYPGLCFQCEKRLDWQRRHDWNHYDRMPRRFYKPRYRYSGSHTMEYYNRLGRYCRKLRL